MVEDITLKKNEKDKSPVIKNNVCLIVIDGWGISEQSHGNAILNAKTPVMDELCVSCLKLEASETHVGVPEGQMGNSEVGHLNIGAGRIVLQDILRINKSISENKMVHNEALVDACKRANTVSGSRIHLIGLVSDGGVHSHMQHMFGIAKACKELKVKKCFLHFISDGRDTSPTSGVGFIQDTINQFNNAQYGELVTIVGRFYSMDRDTNWDKIKVAFDAFVYGKGEACKLGDVIGKVKESYALGNKNTDEFLKPIIIGDESTRIKDNDTIVFFNYRSDRMRQIAKCLGVAPQFDSKLPANLECYCMTQYDATFPFKTLFPPFPMKNVLAEWLSSLHVPQLHVAETEKYAHVTFFFNGGVEVKFDLEERVLVPSPKNITYDMKPSMSCKEVADNVISGIESGKYPFIMLNFAPPDMVGHTGVYTATVSACEATDTQIGRIYEACKQHHYVCMITADHGNAEKMYDENNNPHTAHTLNPVPLVVTGGLTLKCPQDRSPALCDVAPTVLDVMGLPIPSDMTGVSLLNTSSNTFKG